MREESCEKVMGLNVEKKTDKDRPKELRVDVIENDLKIVDVRSEDMRVRRK